MLKLILENLKDDNEYECYQINDKIYTNKDLYKYVCNIYQYLLTNNKERSNVIVYGHKDIYMIASFLACSFAGMTYIPIDESIPQERKEKIIEQSNAKIIIAKKIEEVMFKENYEEIKDIYLNENDTYYIIFTSGSTGEPKGVKILYRNIKSCMKWLKDICNVNGATILNQAIFSFDLSVADIYLSLITKSKHYVLDRDTQKNYVLLFEKLRNSNANLAIITPSFAELLLIDKSFNRDMMPYLEKILFCGEQLTQRTVSKLYERFPNLEIINCYGPTECTFAVTSKKIDKENKEKISIGKAKNDTQVYIVNDNLEKVEEDVIGEILIVGESVGDGYLNTTLNDKSFFIVDNKKAYLTGDLGYKHKEELYCVGRKDKQIKYKGYRIELSEIKKVIEELEEIEKTVVTTLKNKEEKIAKIISFIKIKDNFEITEYEIKQKIEKILPDYMIPIIKIVEKMPLNINGKIDEKQLLEEYLK